MKNTTRVDDISVTELFREGEKATWSAWSKKNKPVLLVSFFKKNIKKNKFRDYEIRVAELKEIF